MVKRNKTSILLSFFIIIALLMPKASAEEVNLAFKVNVAQASNNQQNTTTNNNTTQPLVTEDAKKKQEEINKTTTKEETKTSSQTNSQPVQTSNSTSNSQVISSSTITPTEPSNATGKIISDTKNENGEEVNKKQLEFVEFQTRNQKKLYLIINRADSGKEVKLVTEVSEQDLASMVESTTTKTKQQEVVQEPPKQSTTEEETKSSSGVSILVYIFGLGILGGIAFIIYAGFKKRQKKGREIEEDDEYEEYEEYDEDENVEDDEYYYDKRTDRR